MELIQNSPYVFKDCCGNEIVDFFVAEREIMQNYLPALSLTPVCKSLNKPYHLALIHQILNPYICKTNMNIKLVIVKVFKFLEVIGERAVDVTEVTITKPNLLKKELGALAAKCENLQSLSIENCVWRDNIELGMFRSLKFLSKLVIENRTYNHKGLLSKKSHPADAFFHLPSLKEISFKATAIDSTKLKVFVAGYTELDITYSEGRRYAGGLKNGLPHGKGKFTDSSGDEKTGYFKDGKFKEGRVKTNFPDGSKYEGDVKNGYANGEGKYTYPNGDEEIGLFVNGDFIEGRVKCVFTDGSKYDGCFKNGQPNGDEEIGLFINGNLIKGIFKGTFMDGCTYTGEVENGQPHGKGKRTLTNETGHIEEKGCFIDGKFIQGVVTSMSSNGNIYKAKVKNGEIIEHGLVNDDVEIERFLDRLIMQSK